MKLSLRWLAGASLAMGSALAFAACADDGDPGAPLPTPQDEAGIPLGDAAAPLDASRPDTATADADADAEKPLLCSDAGWCETRFDSSFDVGRIQDLWPLGPTAFAVDPTLGLLEYDGTTWRLVHGETELQSVWASGADDVWSGGTNGKMLHGVRTAGTWTWANEQIGDNTIPDYVVSVWGSGASDVYAVRGTGLYHRGGAADAGDAGSAWTIDYKDPVQDASAQLQLTQVIGSGPDDVWLMGERNVTCASVVHKQQGTYQRVVDCTLDCTSGECIGSAIPNIPMVEWSFGRYGFIPEPRTIITTNGEAPYSLYGPSLMKITLPASGPPQAIRSDAPGLQGEAVWGTSMTDLYTSAASVVLHNPHAFTDGGVFSISTTALDGLPLIVGLTVRGSSASDIWVFGGHYALHQSKP